ncbi:uncharacterized protein LOC123977493 isoform X2 [Micropterus dolomieu]|uniref:uncharacterized protein LOC123977493 isoform X2 n=1 Tax=Micropterus dolomieu TaxID=147949 RepID=UPI001E8CD0AE|nr:uncharacterized protein LOC123977493 isoform X2 [Micropterus dolomieu]
MIPDVCGPVAVPQQLIVQHQELPGQQVEEPEDRLPSVSQRMEESVASTSSLSSSTKRSREESYSEQLDVCTRQGLQDYTHYINLPARSTDVDDRLYIQDFHEDREDVFPPEEIRKTNGYRTRWRAGRTLCFLEQLRVDINQAIVPGSHSMTKQCEDRESTPPPSSTTAQENEELPGPTGPEDVASICFFCSGLSRKRPLFNGYEKEPLLYKKKCVGSLKSLLDRYQTDQATEHARLKTSCGHPCTCEACVNGGTKHLTDADSFFEQISSWADTQHSVNNVLERLKYRQATDDIYLSDSVNKKFLEFHSDITEECGAEDKQHSWAVIEKQEEIVMYGPYYPNYNNGEHSEDVIIKQTEELLETGAVSEDWKVYVFTMNSPCLARNTAPCMLNLVQKAQEWWRAHGVKTHIGYVKCWGFKGAKENLFRDINYSQVDCIHQTEDYESYVKAAEKSTDLKPLCENLFSAVKHLLRSVSVPMINTVQEQDWKSYFKSMHSIFECKLEEEKKIFTEEVNAVIEAAQALLPEKSGFFEECLEKGQAFAFDYTFSSQVSHAIQDHMRLTFQQCWKEMVQDKYAEFTREKLTEDFNQCTIQLFIKDILKLTTEYLQIGRIQFSEKSPQGVKK